MQYVFPNLQLDFANFASQPIIMEIWKEFHVEWESVVFFGMNQKCGRGERRERGEAEGGGGGVGGSKDQWKRRVCPGSFLKAPNYGGRVPVDTTPGPVPMHRAPKSQPLISASTARDAWPPAKPAVTCRCQAHKYPSGHTGP